MSTGDLFQKLVYIDGLVLDCIISIANALEILQSCTKPSIYTQGHHPRSASNKCGCICKGIILCMRSANGRWCYNVTSSLIGWANAQNDPCIQYDNCKVNSLRPMTHWCVGKLIIIGSDNGLSPHRRQAIIWTNAGLLSIGPLWTHENVVCEMAFILSRPQCVNKACCQNSQQTPHDALPHGWVMGCV